MKKESKTNFEVKINELVSNIVNWIKSLFNGKKSHEQVLNLVLTIIVLIFLLWLLKIPFIFLSMLGKGLMLTTFSPIDNFFKIIWDIIIQLTYIIVSLYLMIAVVRGLIVRDIRNYKQSVGEKKTTKKDELTRVNGENNTQPLLSIFMMIIKILIIIAMIPFIIFIIGLLVLLGFLIGLWIKGTALIGAILIIIGIFLIISTVMGLLLKMVFKGDN